jgi:homogentisate 1,2-dioxygenase
MLAFMAETRLVIRPTRFALETPRCNAITTLAGRGSRKKMFKG